MNRQNEDTPVIFLHLFLNKLPTKVKSFKNKSNKLQDTILFIILENLFINYIILTYMRT